MPIATSWENRRVAADDSYRFQPLEWISVSSVFYSPDQRADTRCESRAAVGGRSCSSSSDLSTLVIASYTPQSGLLLTCQSQRRAPPRCLNRLSAARCRCWRAGGAALTYASAQNTERRTLLLCLQLVSMFVYGLRNIVSFMPFNGCSEILTRPVRLSMVFI